MRGESKKDLKGPSPLRICLQRRKSDGFGE